MPIKVIRIERGYKGKNTKMTPTIKTVRGHSYVTGININEASEDIFGKGYKVASSVYITSEIDSKLSSINNSIENLKKDFNDNMNNSLVQIQQELISLKHEILSSKTFKESLKNEILEELRNEITGANNV